MVSENVTMNDVAKYFDDRTSTSQDGERQRKRAATVRKAIEMLQEAAGIYESDLCGHMGDYLYEKHKYADDVAAFRDIIGETK